MHRTFIIYNLYMTFQYKNNSSSLKGIKCPYGPNRVHHFEVEQGTILLRRAILVFTPQLVYQQVTNINIYRYNY